MFTQVKAIFFDLDGTLVDSVPDLATAVDSMMRQLNMPERGQARVRDWVSDGAEELIKRALSNSMAGEVAPELLARARPLFYQAYRECLGEGSQLYPGVAEGLVQLRQRGVPLACVTNKQAELARPLLQSLGILEYFDQLVGGECVQNKKPAPDALLKAAERMGISVGDGLMVGDSINDIRAARNAGCPVVCLPYGYNYGNDIRNDGPDRVIERMTELPGLLASANVEPTVSLH